MCVKWSKVNSAYFNVSNGVRQGGILSPKLFVIYVDDLSHELTLCKSGCYIDDQSLIIMYESCYVRRIYLSHGTKCNWLAKNVRCVC